MVQILYACVFLHFPATGMQNSGETSPSIIFAGQALLVMVYQCFLKLSSRRSPETDYSH